MAGPIPGYEKRIERRVRICSSWRKRNGNPIPGKSGPDSFGWALFCGDSRDFAWAIDKNLTHYWKNCMNLEGGADQAPGISSPILNFDLKKLYMASKIEEILGDFSVTRSGLFHKFLLRVGIGGYSRKDYTKRAIILGGMAWIPLLILSAMQGLAISNKIEAPFLEDFATHARFLLILPVFIFAERAVDFRLFQLTSQLFISKILDEQDLPRYLEIKKRIMRLSGSAWAELLILLLVVGNIWIRVLGKPSETTLWMFLPDQAKDQLSWAGIWYIAFSLPIFQFYILRWLWRWIVWIAYFARIARLPLKLNPAHPDLAGGLGFLGFPPSPFLSVNLALSTIVAAVIAENIVFMHRHLKDYYFVMSGFAVFSIILNVLPLLVFMKPLVIFRRRGVFEYSALIQEHHRQFDKKWLNEKPYDRLLGSDDPSSMIDINSSFDTIMKMRVIPFNLRLMFSSILIAILPMVPLLAFEYNLVELAQKIVKMIL